MSGLVARVAAAPAAADVLVLAVGFDDPEPTAHGPSDHGAPAIRHALGPQEALWILDRERVGIVVTGPNLVPASSRELLVEIERRYPERRHLHIVLAAGDDPELFQELVDRDRIYYLAAGPLPPMQLDALIHAAARRHRELSQDLPGQEPRRHLERLRRLQGALSASRLIAARTDLSQAARVATEGVLEALAADRAYHLIYDPARAVLWSRDPESGVEREESAAAGICSYVARTAQAVSCARVGDHPCYDADADNPEGRDDDQLLAVAGAEAAIGVLVVLVAVRGRRSAAFSDDDREILVLLARSLASVVARLEIQQQVDGLLTDDLPMAEGQVAGIFRREALEQLRLGHRGRGDLLQLSPRWSRWTYWTLLVLVVAFFGYALVGRVAEYGEGPAFIRVRERTQLTAVTAGSVAEVAVRPGQRVATGETLVRFDDARERSELERIEREFELRLVHRLLSPADALAGQALAALRADRALAAARLDTRTVRAPHGGVVSDVRIHRGQHLAPGDLVLSLVPDDASYEVVALLPGHFRPQIRPGLGLRIELSGYEHVYQEVAVDTIGDEIVGPAEALRFLGPELAGAAQLAGPVILVQATLPRRTFTFGGQEYRYHDGMSGTARLRMRSESVLVTLLPSLRSLFEAVDG